MRKLLFLLACCAVLGGRAAAFSPAEFEIYCGFPFHQADRLMSSPAVQQAIEAAGKKAGKPGLAAQVGSFLSDAEKLGNVWRNVMTEWKGGFNPETQAYYDAWYATPSSVMDQVKQKFLGPVDLPFLGDPDIAAISPLMRLLYGLDNKLGSCVPAAQKTKFEGYAADALKFYSTLGFQSPANWRLGPVVQRSGRKVVRLYVVPGYLYDSIASTAGPCSGNWDAKKLSFVTINRDELLGGSDAQAYYTLAHELVHVIQNAQKLVNQERAPKCDVLPHWLGESTADALGIQATVRKFGKFEPALSGASEGLSRNAHSLRSYRVSLPQPEQPLENDLRNYRASSFWRHIVERYHAGNYGVMAKYMAQTRQTPGKPDWLEYLDRVISADVAVTPATAPAGKNGLYLAFPNFLTEYATWGSEKFPKIGESQWLRDTFGVCDNVTLSASATGKKTATLKVTDLQPYAGRCYRVKVTDVQAGQRVAVIPMADKLTGGLEDELHLGTAYAKSLKAFNCFKNFSVQLLGMAAHAGCLFKPFTGAAAGTRVWLAEGDEANAGQNNLEYLWILSWVPVKATDARLGKTASIPELKFSLDVTNAQTSLPLSPPAKSSVPGAQVRKRAVGSVNLGGADGSQELIPMTGSEATGLAPDFSKLAFRVQDFGIGAFQEQVQAATGGDVYALSVSFADVAFGYETLGNQRIPQENFETEGDTIVFYPEKAINFGQTGTFRAFPQGGNNQASEQPLTRMYLSPLDKDGRATLSMTLNVTQFDALGFQANVSGTFCAVPWPPPLVEDLKAWFNAQCAKNTHTLRATIHKPYGTFYKKGAALKVANTPGTQVYAANLTAFLGQVMPGMFNLPGFNSPANPAAPAAPGNAGQGGSAAGTATGCPLTCTQIKQFLDYSENASEGEAPPFSLDLIQQLSAPACVQLLMKVQQSGSCP